MRGRNAAQAAQGNGSEALGGAITLAETAYQRLRQDIVAGVLAPGQSLRLEFLKERYGLSFTPLREALNRLHAERLVVTVALRGCSVAPVSIEEMWDAAETRILLEGDALRRSILNGDDAWEAGIVSAFHALELQVRRMASEADALDQGALSELEMRHHDFHRALIAQCRSRRLLDLSNLLYVETQRYRLPTLWGKGPGTGRDVTLEHRQIMEAALARDAAKAVALLSEHYRKTSEIIETHMSDASRPTD